MPSRLDGASSGDRPPPSPARARDWPCRPARTVPPMGDSDWPGSPRSTGDGEPAALTGQGPGLAMPPHPDGAFSM